jgi:acetylornithine deacetylase
MLPCMDPFALTRQLIDIESTTGNEGEVGEFLFGKLAAVGLHAEKIEAAPGRSNVHATWPEAPFPAVVLSTHMDTVPPFIPSSEDDTSIYGRGSCDAKGIIAAQVAAALRLREEGVHVGLLFLVGEERDSTGALVANTQPRRSRFLINGEPTENRLGVASKGALRVELTAHGRMAHSAYPELGESAIDKLLEALRRLREMPLPINPEVGPCTMNIGLIEGGRAPNVIPDHARAQLLYRLVGPGDELRHHIAQTVSGFAEVDFSLEIPFVKLRTIPGVPTMIASFTTDIPALTNWGQPLLIGPGSIHVAHTEHEYIEKKQLQHAIDLYCTIARQLTDS